MQITWLDILLVSLCVILVVIPTEYDPVIRLGEWLRYKRERR